MSNLGIDELTYLDVVDEIIKLNKDAQIFWSDALGWAPIEAANLLSKSRLDWQTSLSYSMKNWNECICPEAENGDLILAWANLGALIEGTMKLFLSVYYNDYTKDPDSLKNKDGTILPDVLKLESLRQYFSKNIWKYNKEASKFDDEVLFVQQRRNAIHAFESKQIDNFHEFRLRVKKYLVFLKYHLDRLPYPHNRDISDLYL